MYTTCLFCHADLGANEVIEHFPVGRRLAFDAAKGRLWVVCRKCERWNLTPLDDRWEAIEECERLFTSTRLRVSTGNVGLSRVREGLELVRIGQPQRPELAAWRYGDQFGRRRWRYMGMTVGAGAIVAGIMIAGPASGVIAGGGWGMWQLTNALIKAGRDRMVRTKVAIPGYDQPSIIRGRHLKRIVLSAQDDRWSLRIPNTALARFGEASEAELFGDDALRAASKLLPAVNLKGGNKQQVQDAVAVLELTPDPERLFVETARTGAYYQKRRPAGNRDRRRSLPQGEVFLDRVAAVTSLALEMAAHEDIERRAMEGELALLENAWREAEELAGIADNLLLSASVDEEYQKLASHARDPK